MKRLTLCTFNVENLFLRYNFASLPPGITSKKVARADVAESVGFLPMNYDKNYYLFKDEARELTAQALTQGSTAYPDICCLQEIESMQALRTFNKSKLDNKYPYILVIDAYDPRLIDIGILSMHPIAKITTHMDEKDDRGYPFFSRDCLEVTFEIGGRALSLFVNHLKSKYGKSQKEKDNGNQRRKAQAERVAQILKERYPGSAYDSELFAVTGDFNDSPDSEFVAPLVKDAGLENVIERLAEPERWTHWWAGKNLVSQLDYMLLSPELSKRVTAGPAVERRGLSAKRKKSYFALPGDEKGAEVDFAFDRFEGVTDEADASDHCPTFLEIEI